MVIAREGITTDSPDPVNPCSVPHMYDSLNDLTKAAVRHNNGEPWLNMDESLHAYGGSNPTIRCGMAQRSWAWNRACAEIFPLVEMAPRALNTFEVTSGEYAYQHLMQDTRHEPTREVGSLCYLLERRRFAQCPSGLSCTAGGECVAPRATRTQVLNLSPPAAGGTGGT
jgi:hypothetical protein